MAKDDKRIERLEKAVEKAEKKQRKLKKRVEELEEVVTDLQEADDASPAPVDSESADADAADQTADETATGRPELSEPDESWTVARLREAALSRGLTGISRMTKAELLAAVSEAGHRG